jgi:hypothetical protein
MRTIFLSAVGVWLAAPAAAQNACASGDITVIRVSKLTAKGTTAGFEKALADQKRWYSDHGYTKDEIVAAPVLVVDPKTSALKKSPNLVITFHYRSVEISQSKRDAAWNAFVAEYQANTDIVSETVACMPG